MLFAENSSMSFPATIGPDRGNPGINIEIGDCTPRNRPETQTGREAQVFGRLKGPALLQRGIVTTLQIFPPPKESGLVGSPQRCGIWGGPAPSILGEIKDQL